MSAPVPEVLALQGFDVRARQIEQCEVVVLTGVGLLGPTHALLVGNTGSTATVVVVLLTAAQAFAVFSIISAIFVGRELKKDADLGILVVRIPIVCCSAAGALIVLATCIVHWKAAYGIAVLAAIFLLVVYRGTVIALGKRLANWNTMLFTRVSNTVLTFGECTVNWSAILLTGVGKTARAFGGWLATGWVTIASRLRSPPAEGLDLEMGVGNGDGE